MSKILLSKINNLFSRYIKVRGLRKKILVSIVGLLLLLGLSITLITRMILLNVLRTEFRHKGVAIARSLAANSLVDVLTLNASRLKKLVENEKSLDKDIAYAFIIDSSGRVLAHTFDKGFPVELTKANTPKKDKIFNIQLLDTQLGLIYDIAVPITLEKSLLGQARLGILQNSIQRTITTINIIFIITTFIIIVIGILLAYRVSFLITNPISKLVKATQLIQKRDFSAKIDVRSKDEIGILASAFNEMGSNLSIMVEEIRRLTMFKERNRIALDLHDGCMQDLANIIKRLELCERLFKIDPQTAFKELKALRENTKDILNNTRHVIFNLKSSQDSEFALLNNLTRYIEDYQRQNDINVAFDISGSIEHIAPDKAKSIFYIITEALANIRKHSLAKKVELNIESNDSSNLRIDIKDNGKGFDIDNTVLNASAAGGLGLISMRQRTNSLGGTFNIESIPHQGTRIHVDIPLGDSRGL
jgi:signal transduction histidine kinase